MPSPTNDSTWDFSPVFDLINSLSHKNVGSGRENESPTPFRRSRVVINENKVKDQLKQGLGNFSQLWDYLGVQQDVPSATVPPFESSTAGQKRDKDAYASDGALYYPPSSKSVKWRDEEEGLDLTDFQPESPPNNTSLTKTQRKKLNRKERKAREWVTLAEQKSKEPKKKERVDRKGSGDDSEGSPPASARAAAIHKLEPQPVKRVELVSTASLPKTSAKKSTGQETKQLLQAVEASARHSLQSNTDGALRLAQVIQHSPNGVASSPKKFETPLTNGFFITPATPQLSNGVASLPKEVETPSKNVSPPLHVTPQTPSNKIISAIHESLQKQRPSANSNSPATRMQPSTVQVARTQPVTTITSKQRPNNAVASPASARKRHEILPIVHKDAVERNWALLLKLLHNFPADRKYLTSPLQLSINRPTPNGIHIFVDASNILIGFHDTLKRARGIPVYAHVPRPDLNFHALALLLERRRPVTKRVLAGSTPEIPAYEEARQVGYETCLLDKVWKAKELTERQRRFATRDSMGRNGYQSGSDSAGNGALSAYGFADGAEVPEGSGFVLPPQQPKWVEQAVDEILHLKILESVVDTIIPAPTIPPSVATSNGQWTMASPEAPTMVLATGDAAEAEYSQGFMKMVQRALARGWNVEVAAWAKSVSMEYRRMEKSAALGDRFKIIELDEYAEELFGEGVS